MSGYKRAVGADQTLTYRRIYLTDFDVAWSSSLAALKSVRLEVANKDSGVMQTQWVENTADRNFVDSFGSADSYLKAEYRLKLQVARGFYNGKPSVTVTALRDQRVERDVLEGWKFVETDGVEENTLLYRIGRLIYVETQRTALEDARVKREMRQVEVGTPPAESPAQDH